MAIDVKKLVDAIQKKEHAVTSSTSTQDMIDILKAAKKLQGSVINSYADSSALPDPLTTNERIAYLEDTKVIKLNNGVWDDPTGGVEAAGGGATNLRGSAFGYRAGGQPSSGASNVIDKYPYTADGNATDVGDLDSGVRETSGSNSLTHGYAMGGDPPQTSAIQKYSFSVDGNASYVADLLATLRLHSTSMSLTHGYAMGGYDTGWSNRIQKFIFASDGNGADVGDMTVSSIRQAGLSSSTHGYTAGGSRPSSSNIIEKFTFSADANATDVGDLTVARTDVAGLNSDTHGYAAGGNPGGGQNIIDKFPFSADGNATDVGDLVHGTTYLQNSKSNSTTHGYLHGGVHNPGPGARINEIQKFSFSVDGNSTDVGDLTGIAQMSAGAQV